MLYPIYDYYHESSLTLEEVLHHYVENFYFRKHGRDKFDKILKKLSESSKVRSLFDESYQKRLAPNNVDFGATVNSIMWFMIQSNETQAVAVLAMATFWNTNVNSHLHLKSDKELRDDALMIFKEFQIYGDMTQEEFDRMRYHQDEDENDEYPELDEDVDDEDDEEDYDKNEAHIRSTIRKGLEEHMAKTMQEHGDLMNDPFTGGLMVEAAIGSYFQSLRKQNALYVIASHFGVNLDGVLDEESSRALSKYLK